MPPAIFLSLFTSHWYIRDISLGQLPRPLRGRQLPRRCHFHASARHYWYIDYFIFIILADISLPIARIFHIDTSPFARFFISLRHFRFHFILIAFNIFASAIVISPIPFSADASHFHFHYAAISIVFRQLSLSPIDFVIFASLRQRFFRDIIVFNIMISMPLADFLPLWCRYHYAIAFHYFEIFTLPTHCIYFW